MRIAVALFDDAEELDWAGPWEVLAFWARMWPDDGVDVCTVANGLEPVTCAKGLRVLPDVTWAELGTPDLLVYPGGRGPAGSCRTPPCSSRCGRWRPRGRS